MAYAIRARGLPKLDRAALVPVWIQRFTGVGALARRLTADQGVSAAKPTSTMTSLWSEPAADPVRADAQVNPPPR